MAAALGAPCVSLWSGAPPEGSSATREELDARLVDGLRTLCRRAAESGVLIAFEPEPGMYVESMADFDRIADAVASPALRLTLDVGHAHLTEDSAVETVRRYAARIANVHLEGMKRPVHDHLAPWEGDLDLRAVVRALDEVGYAGPATFELSRHSHAAVDTARRAIEFIRALC
jgi:sugar phosphate isomerase/epimerase